MTNNNQLLNHFKTSDITENDYDFIEKVIDSYLLVKSETLKEEYISRYDFLTLVIEKMKTM